jgi:phosphoribosylanthranilate isomerase
MADRVADALLLDTMTQDRIGGTGVSHDWGISARIVEDVARPIILAGGLTPENVADAIGRVKPAAVDVNSGVEREDGSKHPVKVRDFIARAREAFMDTQPKSGPRGIRAASS